MGNSLTGEFDVVAEFGLGAVNRILAAQHQESGPDQIYPHSIRTIVQADVVAGVRGIAEIQVSTPTITLPAENGQPDDGPVVGGAVGGVIAAPSPISSLLGLTEEVEPTVGVLPDRDFIIRGDESRVTIHLEIRVRFRPDAGSAAAPEFVHGALRLTVSADQIISSLTDVVSIRLDTDDLVISFAPAAGAPLSATERNLVVTAARHIVTNELGALNLVVDLPPVVGGFGLSHWRFKTLSHPSRSAVALLLNLQPDRFPTRAHRQSYANNFLQDSDSFAFAIGRDFLIPLLEDLLEEQIVQGVSGTTYTVPIPWVSDPTYTISLDGKPDVTLQQGAIRISVSLDATTPNWTPDVDVTLTQSIGLTATAGTVQLVLVDDLDIDFSFRGGLLAWVANRIRGLFRSDLKNAVSAALVQAVNDAQPLLRKALAQASLLTEKLRISPPTLSYTSVDITAAGITVHGDLTIAEWEPVVVAFDSRRLLADPPQLAGSTLEYTALDSWVPGGSVRRYRWVKGDGFSIDAEQIHRHQFTMQPARSLVLSYMSSWCLEVIGVQDGKEVVGSNCGLIGPPIVAWPDSDGAKPDDPPLPVTVLDTAGNLVAHVDLSGKRTGRRPRDVSPANVLVHFAGSEPQSTFDLLRGLLSRLSLGERELLVISVLSPGSLNRDLARIELDTPNAHLLWAEDHEGSWTNAYEAGEGNPAMLVHSGVGIVWRSSTKPVADELAEALERYLTPELLPGPRMLRPAVREQTTAPNFLFEFLHDASMKLSTLRGRRVYVSFFKTWSQPGQIELQRLQMLQEQQGRRGAVVLAVADGEDGREAQALFEECGFTFRLVADPDRQIARQYGIVAWPTTITIDERGQVHEVRSGASAVPKSVEGEQDYDQK